MIYSCALWVLDSRFELRSWTALIGLLVASAGGSTSTSVWLRDACGSFINHINIVNLRQMFFAGMNKKK
jgi:hypothetical protein